MNGTIIVNGAQIEIDFDPADTLLDVLRDNGHTEVKRGCSKGECGTCLVLLDDLLVNSCQVFAATALGKKVTTSSGLNGDGRPHVIHESFADAGAVQCGFCTPGMVMATHSLLTTTPDPTDEEIRLGLVGNLCRCTGYVKIFDAVKLACKRMRKDG
ncbi:MAG: (2Fe-2S)-binding protein [Spirochaetales bacterium]|nr:(2Fe-2S)-binding protein [Spirochaetales bacterium]